MHSANRDLSLTRTLTFNNKFLNGERGKWPQTVIFVFGFVSQFISCHMPHTFNFLLAHSIRISFSFSFRMMSVNIAVISL